MADQVVEPEDADDSGTKVYTFRVPNRDAKLVDFFIELDKAGGVVKSTAEWACQVVVAAARQRLAEMTPETIEQEAQRHHAEIDARKAKAIEMFNTFVK